MCRRIECHECHKPGYVGCGMHIEQVLGDVAPGERCTCRERRDARSSLVSVAPRPKDKRGP